MKNGKSSIFDVAQWSKMVKMVKNGQKWSKMDKKWTKDGHDQSEPYSSNISLLFMNSCPQFEYSLLRIFIQVFLKFLGNSSEQSGGKMVSSWICWSTHSNNNSIYLRAGTGVGFCGRTVGNLRPGLNTPSLFLENICQKG